MGKRVRAYSAYRVVTSTVEQMPVGAVLIDKGVLLEARWDIFNFDTGEESFAVGKRIGRICGTCKEKYSRGANLGHAGDCGPDSPKFVPDNAPVGSTVG